MNEHAHTSRAGLGWAAFVSLFAATACLLSGLIFVGAGAALPRAARPRYTYAVRACAVVHSKGATSIGFGWKASGATRRPYRWVRLYHNAVCSTLPWGPFLPTEGVVVVPMSGARAAPQALTAEQPG